MGCGASSVVDKALAKKNLDTTGLRLAQGDIAPYSDLEPNPEPTKWLSDNEREQELVEQEITDVKDLVVHFSVCML
jgi:hypothetical protein